MNYTREQLLEDALDVAMRSLGTYGEHPIIEQQARKAKDYQNGSDKNSVIDVVSKSLPDEIYATYDKKDGEIFCAFTSKERCEMEQKEGGCGMQTVRLIKGERFIPY